jgi:hypothetical protein
MTKISDQMKGNARPTSTAATPEGGSDLALSLGGAVQDQTNEMVAAASAAQISIHCAADQLSSYFARVASGQELLNETLAMTHEKLQAMGGPVTIETEVKPITINLPESRDFAETRRGFLDMFGAAPTVDPSYILSGPTAADEVSGDE